MTNYANVMKYEESMEGGYFSAVGGLGLASKSEQHILGLIDEHKKLLRQYKGFGIFVNFFKVRKLNKQIINHQEYFPEYYL